MNIRKLNYIILFFVISLFISCRNSSNSIQKEGKTNGQFQQDEVEQLKKEVDSLKKLNGELQNKNSLNIESGLTEEASSNFIQIGNQIWMAKNFNLKSFQNGDPIPQAITNSDWIDAARLGKPAWCYFQNSNTEDFGILYNWYALNDVRRLLPAGWKLPSNSDWDYLIEYSGGFEIAGGNLKSKGFEFWLSPNKFAANRDGFNALPSGSRGSNGSFSNPGYFANWWSSTSSDDNKSYVYSVNTFDAKAERNIGSRGEGFSVRGIKVINSANKLKESSINDNNMEVINLPKIVTPGLKLNKIPIEMHSAISHSGELYKELLLFKNDLYFHEQGFKDPTASKWLKELNYLKSKKESHDFLKFVKFVPEDLFLLASEYISTKGMENEYTTTIRQIIEQSLKELIN